MLPSTQCNKPSVCADGKKKKSLQRNSSFHSPVQLELSEKKAELSTAWDQRLQEKKQLLLRVFTGSTVNSQIEGVSYWIQNCLPDEKTEASRAF